MYNYPEYPESYPISEFTRREKPKEEKNNESIP